MLLFFPLALLPHHGEGALERLLPAATAPRASPPSCTRTTARPLDESRIKRFRLCDVNAIYRGEAVPHQLDCEPAGFEWIDFDDTKESPLGDLRRGTSTSGARALEELAMG